MPYVKEKACRRWKEKGQRGGERERKGNVFQECVYVYDISWCKRAPRSTIMV